jgi:hypothetical protein
MFGTPKMQSINLLFNVNIATQNIRTFPSIFELKEVAILREFDALLFAHVMVIQNRRQIKGCSHKRREKFRSHISNYRRDFSVKFVPTQGH